MIRKIEYNIDNEGIISPTEKQDAGFVGEHNATSIIFKPDSSLITAIKEAASSNVLYYRFEITDGENSRFSTEPIYFEEINEIEFNLTNAFTKVKGELTVTLIFEATGTISGVTLFSFPAKLSLKESNTGVPEIIKEYQNVSTVSENVTEIYNEITTIHGQIEGLTNNNKTLAAEVEANANSVETNTATVIDAKKQVTAMTEEVDSNTKATLSAAKEAGEFAVSCTTLCEETARLAQEAQAFSEGAEESRTAAALSEENAVNTVNSANALLEETKSLVENKADISYVDSEVNNIITDTQNKLNSKANITYVDNAVNNTISDTQSKLDSKADITYVDNSLNNTTNEIKDILNNNFACAIKNTVSGEFISVNDVSDTHHNVNIKLSSDSITDFSEVTVIQYGKNILNATKLASANNCNYYSKSGNSFTLRGNTGTSVCAYDAGQLMFPTASTTVVKTSGIDVKANITYTLTYEALLIELGKYGNEHEVIVYDQNLNIIVNKRFYNLSNATPKKYSLSFVPTSNNKIAICFRVNNHYLTISNLQLEIGSASTDYEPFKQSIQYSANADGTVEGVKSISPNMRLIPYMQGVSIEAVYIADTKLYIDNKLKELQS